MGSWTSSPAPQTPTDDILFANLLAAMGLINELHGQFENSTYPDEFDRFEDIALRLCLLSNLGPGPETLRVHGRLRDVEALLRMDCSLRPGVNARLLGRVEGIVKHNGG
jgi:hypothetical protein